MEISEWEKNRENREKAALAEHDRLHRLFRENRFAFELERKRKIEEVIARAGDEVQRRRLRELQASWDKKMRGAGSKSNRFILAQTFFWEHFHEKWQPALEEASGLLNPK